LLHVTLPASRILRWLLEFWKICASLEIIHGNCEEATNRCALQTPKISIRPMATDFNINNPLPVYEFGSIDEIYSDAPLCY
jgi:hypothetical protein